MTEIRYASFTKRLLAFLIDVLIFILIHLFSWYLISASSNINQLAQNVLIYLITVLLPTFIFGSIIYTALMTSRFGGSLGKLLTGIKVTDETGNLLTVKRSIFRHTIGYTFSYTFFGLGYLAIIKDKLKQGWHDKATGSLVIVKNNIWPVGLVTLIILIAANTLITVSAIERFSKGPVKDEVLEIASAYQNEKKIEEGTPSASPVSEKTEPQSANPNINTQPQTLNYTQEDIAAWREEIAFIDQDLTSINNFKGNSSYDQQKLTRTSEILLERRSIASTIYNKMLKGLPMNASDDKSLNRYDLLTIEVQQLTKELFRNY